MPYTHGAAMRQVCTYSVERLKAGRELNSAKIFPAGVRRPLGNPHGATAVAFAAQAADVVGQSVGILRIEIHMRGHEIDAIVERVGLGEKLPQPVFVDVVGGRRTYSQPRLHHLGP